LPSQDYEPGEEETEDRHRRVKEESLRLARSTTLLERKLEQERKRARILREDVHSYENGNHKTILYLERVRGQRMSLWWYLMVILTLFCCFGTFSTGAYVVSAANFFGFLLVWRKLYVDVNMIPMFVALLFCLITIKFV
jgi:hypothetical protein